MLSHANIINTAKLGGDIVNYSTADRTMIVLPLFHCFGLVGSMLCSVVHGCTMYLPNPTFSPVKALECIEKHKITTFLAVPMMFYAMLMMPQSARTAFSSLRPLATGGAPIPPTLVELMYDRLPGVILCAGYGQTECGTLATYLDENASIEDICETVGVPIQGVECAIADLETGEHLPDNVDGEILMRGFGIMQGYYKMPEATAATIDKDGWLHTGDTGRRRSDGQYVITGRIKDMIIRGGENIYPKEIEDFLNSHDDINDVQVVAVPDPALGEEVFAWVQVDPGTKLTGEKLREWAVQRLARQKVPRYFEFTDDDFPVNASGKILKYKLRAMAEEILGIHR
jgi:fatty-acyl-CoA synthase